MKNFDLENEEKFQQQLQESIQKAEKFSVEMNDLRKVAALTPFEFCIHCMVAANSCEEAFPNEWKIAKQLVTKADEAFKNGAN